MINEQEKKTIIPFDALPPGSFFMLPSVQEEIHFKLERPVGSTMANTLILQERETNHGHSFDYKMIVSSTELTVAVVPITIDTIIANVRRT